MTPRQIAGKALIKIRTECGIGKGTTVDRVRTIKGMVEGALAEIAAAERPAPAPPAPTTEREEVGGYDRMEHGGMDRSSE